MLKETNESAVIQRLDPGRLLYVEIGGEIIPFKPDRIDVRDPDGSLRPYRGESFYELGLNVGQKLSVVRDSEGAPMFIIDPPRNALTRALSAAASLRRLTQ